MSVISYACAALWFLIICATRKRIYLAIAIVKEASSAISAMPILIAYPILPVLGFVLFLIPWVVYMVYLASSGEITTQCICSGQSDINTTMNAELENIALNDTSSDECDEGCYMYRNYEYAKNTQYAGLYLVFTFFWTTQFIIAWYVTMHIFQEEQSLLNHLFLIMICIIVCSFV